MMDFEVVSPLQAVRTSTDAMTRRGLEFVIVGRILKHVMKTASPFLFVDSSHITIISFSFSMVFMSASYAALISGKYFSLIQ